MEENTKTIDDIINELYVLDVGEVSVFDVKKGHDITETLGCYMGACKVIIIGQDNQHRGGDDGIT